MSNQPTSPWLNGIDKAAAYAHVSKEDMRAFVKSDRVISRRKPRADGSAGKHVLVFAPSVDALIMAQPSGADATFAALR